MAIISVVRRLFADAYTGLNSGEIVGLIESICPNDDVSITSESLGTLVISHYSPTQESTYTYTLHTTDSLVANSQSQMFEVCTAVQLAARYAVVT